MPTAALFRMNISPGRELLSTFRFWVEGLSNTVLNAAQNCINLRHVVIDQYIHSYSAVTDFVLKLDTIEILLHGLLLENSAFSVVIFDVGSQLLASQVLPHNHVLITHALL